MGVRYACISCLVLVWAFAQQNAGLNHIITLDVVVADKAGKPVSGLDEQDFTLLDNKQPRKVVSFHAVQGAAAAAEPPVEVILLVDEINTSYSRIAYVRDELEKFLRRSGGELPRPVTMAFLSDSGLSIGNDYSQDGNAVLAQLKQRSSSLRADAKSQGIYGGEDRVQKSLNAVNQLIDYEMARPGRKLVVWISPGWPFLSSAGMESALTVKQRQALFTNIVAFSDGLSRARLTIYSLDPQGAGEDTMRTSEYKDFIKGAATFAQVQLGNLALQVLAYESGGRVFNASNDVSGEIAQCLGDLNTYYVLTLDGAAAKAPNEYHALELKIAKPGLTPRTRSGYYAQPEGQ
jgi:VWFA-related protein